MDQQDRTLTDERAAEYLGMATQTLRNWRTFGKGPEYLKMGRSVRYRLSALETYKDECTIKPRQQ